MNLVQFNIWLDTVFVIIYVCVWLFLGWHFAMSIIKGRFRKSFIEGHWPEHDSRPPALPKFLHAQHMIMMIVLGISGMYIRFPYFSGGRIAMRYIHYFAMIVVTINLVWRIWYAFWSKARDYKEFAIGKKDVASLGGILKYYGYLSNEKPHVAKYNVAQKGSYFLFLVMMVFMVFTGFSLVTSQFIFGYSPRDILVGWWLGALVGSTDLAGWYMRMFHYVLNWAFIIMTTVHVYLSATIDIPCTLDFFGIKEMPINPDAHGHGHDDHGDAGHDAPQTFPTPVQHY